MSHVHSEKINGGMWLKLYEIALVDCKIYLFVTFTIGGRRHYRACCNLVTSLWQGGGGGGANLLVSVEPCSIEEN